MKHLLITTIAAVVLVGCADSELSLYKGSISINNYIFAETIWDNPGPFGVPLGIALFVFFCIAMLRKQNQGPASREARIAAFFSRPIKPESTLHKAVTNFEIDVVKQLLANGANVNANAEYGRPLHNAVTFEKDQFAKAKEMVELLLAKGAKVNAKDDLGNTALHDLCSYSGGLSPAIAEILIANGAKVNIKDEDGVTPLSLAAQNGTIELIELLIKAGANVNSKDRCGTTVLGWGEDNPEVVKLLLRRGAK